MAAGVKTVHDPLHGGVRVDGFFLDLLNRHEMQRLRGVKQLGSANLVFPGANHTRFEHCLGTYALAGRMAEAIGLNEEDTLAVRTAGLLHDICHGPFSHSTEEIMEDRTGLDHMELARRLIKGQVRTYRKRDEDLFGGSDSIAEVIAAHGVDPDEVCDLIAYPTTTPKEANQLDLDGNVSYFPSKDYIHQIIHGPVDADQMDYLVRDAHYTGVAMGNIDIDRLLDTMRVVNDCIVIARSGAPAAEGLMVSRALMYSSVYYHQTVRIIKCMLTKAVEAADLDLQEIYLWDDADLTAALIAKGGVPSYLVRCLQNRVLYKKAVSVLSSDTSNDLAAFLARHSPYRKRQELEQEIADKAGVELWQVSVETPSPSTLLSKIKIGKTGVSILDPDGKVRSLARSSPIARALQSRDAFGWSLVVSCPASCRGAVTAAAKKVLSL
ncbi:MAG: HD domain-containing protein [Candidatus Methanomethylophilus sp.]|nr:HD domain-containing protein [Methanomethylophilus sp.]